MKRRSILSACAVLGAGTGIFTASGLARAQPAGKVWRIGVLSLTPGASEATEVFREALRSLGYVEGRNLSIEYRWAAGKVDRLPDFAMELVQLKVDLIWAPTGLAAVAAKRATNSIPIVMSTAPDPVGMGLIANLGRPGGNVTGTTNMATDLVGKRLQLIRELLQKTTRIAVLVMKAAPGTPGYLEEVQNSAQLAGVTLVVRQENQPEALAAAFAAMQQERAQALVVQVSPFTLAQRKQILELAAQHRLPAIFETREFVDAGGLLSYGSNQNELVRRAAYYVDRIFKGTAPADLPVEQPTKFEMVLNLKTAKALGLTVPYSLRLQATEMIE